MRSDWLPNVWLVENGDYWQARWTDRHGKRCAKSLGSKAKVSKREATRLCRSIGFKLTTGEMAGGGRAPGLKDFIDQYVRLRAELSPATIAQAVTTGQYLRAFFGDDHRIDRISKEEAQEWRAALAAGSLVESRKIDPNTRGKAKLTPATVAKHAATAKAIFGYATDELELIPRNPFAKIQTKAAPIEKDWKEISRADLGKILAACPNDGWRALFALCRLTGIRRGEAFRLEWRDLIFPDNAMLVNARLEETTKRAYRECPIEAPKLPAGLAAILLDIRSRSTSPLVCAGADMQNIHKSTTAILAASGVGVYAKPFHTLRKCFENELIAKYPLHTVEDWMGHSAEVAKKHYLRTKREEFIRDDRVQDRVQTAGADGQE